jgi:succinate-acetate transporter protein
VRDKEEFMSIIHARRDDWIPHNPRISVGGWIGAIVAVAVIYVAAAAIIGHLINGNGAPFLMGGL